VVALTSGEPVNNRATEECAQRARAPHRVETLASPITSRVQVLAARGYGNLPMVSALHLVQSTGSNMRSKPRQWAQTLIMSHDDLDVDDDALVVVTPLDLITRLEHEHESIGSVVLGRQFADLAATLRELYPAIPVVEQAS
jgi:hypothetical protein